MILLALKLYLGYVLGTMLVGALGLVLFILAFVFLDILGRKKR